MLSGCARSVVLCRLFREVWKKTSLSGSNLSIYLPHHFRSHRCRRHEFISPNHCTHGCFPLFSNANLFSIYTTIIGVCHTQHHKIYNCIWNTQLFGTHAGASNWIQFWLLMPTSSYNHFAIKSTVYLLLYLLYMLVCAQTTRSCT